MEIIIYADFSCPYSYLASLRVDQLLWSGAADIDWRAMTRRTDDGCDDRGLATVAALSPADNAEPEITGGTLLDYATAGAFFIAGGFMLYFGVRQPRQRSASLPADAAAS